MQGKPTRSVLKNYSKGSRGADRLAGRAAARDSRFRSKKSKSAVVDVQQHQRKQIIKEKAEDPRVVAPAPSIWLSKSDRFTIPDVSANQNIFREILNRSVTVHSMVLKSMKSRIIERKGMYSDDGRVEILSN